MEEDRRNIIEMEAKLLQAGGEQAPVMDQQERAVVENRHGGVVSTNQYLQRQRQLLLEDYLRKHMSLPLQAQSPVLAGLQQLQPPRKPHAETPEPPHNTKTREELLGQLAEMEAKARS